MPNAQATVTMFEVAIAVCMGAGSNADMKITRSSEL
jgi:hypothetical protein